MKVVASWLCTVSIVALALLPSPGIPEAKGTKSSHVDRVFLDVDHVSGDNVWIRLNNESDVNIWVMNLPSPRGCEDFTEYYLEKVVQLKFPEATRRALDAQDPSLAGRTEEEVARRHFLPRTISIREERHMNWSDAVPATCRTLAPKKKASFQVPLATARQYERLYVVYYYSGRDSVQAEKVPEHRVYFDVSSLNQHQKM